MRIMFLSHMPESAETQAREAKVKALLESYASPGTEVEVGYPDDYAGARASNTSPILCRFLESGLRRRTPQRSGTAAA